MFYFSKCTQPCSQSALHFLLFSFLWFTDKNTWGGKKAQYQIPGGSDLPQEKNVAHCITGAHAHAGSKEAQQAEQSMLTQMLWCQELPTTSPAMRAVSHSLHHLPLVPQEQWRKQGVLSVRGKAVCWAILQPQSKSNQEFESQEKAPGRFVSGVSVSKGRL